MGRIVPTRNERLVRCNANWRVGLTRNKCGLYRYRLYVLINLFVVCRAESVIADLSSLPLLLKSQLQASNLGWRIPSEYYSIVEFLGKILDHRQCSFTGKSSPAQIRLCPGEGVWTAIL
jgi:hypothetical protein